MPNPYSVSTVANAGAFGQRLHVEAEPPRLLLEQLAPELEAALLLLGVDVVLDLVARPRGDDEVQPVAARMMPGRGDNLHDVAVAEARAQRHHLAVDPRADALMADVGVDGVREVDRRRVARKRLHLPGRREDVDLFGIELDLQVLQELLRIADLLLELEQLAKPDEVLLVAIGADAAFLVLPVRGDPFLRDPMHLGGADLDLEGKPAIADHRRVQRLVAVGPRHRDEVLDASRDRRPRLVDDARAPRSSPSPTA